MRHWGFDAVPTPLARLLADRRRGIRSSARYTVAIPRTSSLRSIR